MMYPKRVDTIANPNFDRIITQLDSGQSFSLTNSQYKKSTGFDIPKSTWYLLNQSAVAKRAKEHGYKLIAGTYHIF